ncbi:MAG: hypothetical protein IKD83_06025 [Firmicutes bacterium]|nr:hypothetical protein [Bacillota bacterium]
MKDFYSAFTAEYGRVSFFHSEKGVLYEEIRGKTFEKNAISINSSGRFCVCAGDEIFVFAEETDGSLDFFRKTGGLWKKQTLIERGFPPDAQFKVFFAGGRLIMLLGNGKNVMMSEFRDGIWGKPVNTGEGECFHLCGVSEGSFSIALRDKVGNIYLKEVSRQGKERVLFLKNADKIVDISFLNCEDGLYCAYIMKSMFSMRIWFRIQGGNAKEIFVWEGVYADKVLVLRRKETIYVLWTMGDIYMFSEYDEERHEFREGGSGKAVFGGRAEKAYFTDLSGDFDFEADEILYGRGRIPDIFVRAEEPESEKEKIRKEEYKKDEEILRLSRLLEERSSEVFAINGSMRTKTKNLNKRIKELEAEIERLKSEKEEEKEE